MDILSGDIFSLVFRRIQKRDMGEYSLTGQMLTLLMHLDGKKDIKTIAKSSGMDMNNMRVTLSKLLALDLIEPVAEAVPMLNADFVKYLEAQLSLATGPIAGILIEDAVEALGVGLRNIPRHRAAELTDMLARQIPREEKKIAFQQAMIKKIKEPVETG
ncbi:MAG: hypothetical protein JW755_03240 [Candidatus Aminicenantes bacterium]|nr:hypothetical protein [Candidatus Aminicenantes bacterium]